MRKLIITKCVTNLISKVAQRANYLNLCDASERGVRLWEGGGNTDKSGESIMNFFIIFVGEG